MGCCYGPIPAKEGSQTQQVIRRTASIPLATQRRKGRLQRPRQRGTQLPGPEHSCPLAASMVPQRKSDFSQIVLRALCTGACVSLVNACVAGECRAGGLTLAALILPLALVQGQGRGSGLSGSPWAGAWPCPPATFPAQGSSTCPGGLRSTARPS